MLLTFGELKSMKMEFLPVACWFSKIVSGRKN